MTRLSKCGWCMSWPESRACDAPSPAQRAEVPSMWRLHPSMKQTSLFWSYACIEWKVLGGFQHCGVYAWMSVDDFQKLKRNDMLLSNMARTLPQSKSPTRHPRTHLSNLC
eukprot:6427420-Amphidinium_carterae.1